MKDLTISITILLILTVLFSVYGTPDKPNEPALKTETRGDGTRERGEGSEILQGNGGDQMVYLESPKTGYFD